MSLQVFMLPDLGEGLVEAELVTWLVAVGDTVHVDQPIAEVETAKSVVEVPSPFEGVVDTLHGAEGDTLVVGRPLISVALPGAAAAPAAVAPPAGDASVPPTPPPVAENVGGSGNVLIGYGTSGHGGAGRTRPSRLHRINQRAAVGSAAATVPTARATAPLVVSPLVRKMAHDSGLSLAEIQGSGADGLIRRRDVEAALALASAPAASAPAPQALLEVPAAGPAVDSRTGLQVLSRTALTGVKKAAATALARSRREIPEATVWVDVDATALVELRAGLKAKDGSAPSLLAFVARFATAGLARFPQLNTQLVSENGTDTVVEFDGINLGFAAQTDRGLMVPVLRGAQGRSARELDSAIRAVTGKAREGKAGPAELSGGTFTINNYGVFGVDGSAAIINYPEAAMLGIGRITDKPWVVDGQLCVRKLTELTLAFDHRVCDGAVAAGFLRFIADSMENPAGALADL
ncbi:pyruvate dehydrogenase E2 component (dihydrolipoamide acetyltransferase) [Arthrobacter silviterrae]|uniref:Dihydrolipoamide acetyltransferase component of pyruvate dehydrogenase complex n=1 Tax=Arthrobacter silviterrae TaxID=2026658 RepID=A0ABX0DEN3_9MICC|nr:dihydrolipoamide acetyltransferase family protein [Arthrobacter silviterrae]MDQ0277804.1 pyruvate dehydrogenase E2 component (dihydrolipoamide acetyltransferase) [Arthrobacter silviterrae]NGN83830.1 2-oxo acid dehydrogenase subunit E2 [Arthrobacter silviterrae]